jgi:hypothetical protein
MELKNFWEERHPSRRLGLWVADPPPSRRPARPASNPQARPAVPKPAKTMQVPNCGGLGAVEDRTDGAARPRRGAGSADIMDDGQQRGRLIHRPRVRSDQRDAARNARGRSSQGLR